MSKEARQTTVCDFIRTQYTDFRRLRFDVVSGKTQIRDLPAPSAEDAANTGGNDRSRLLEGENEQGWRDITNADINDIICQITLETGVNICSREVLAALQSHQIPHVHPLREWLLSLPEYTPEQGDWIGAGARSAIRRQDTGGDRRTVARLFPKVVCSHGRRVDGRQGRKPACARAYRQAGYLQDHLARAPHPALSARLFLQDGQRARTEQGRPYAYRRVRTDSPG